MIPKIIHYSWISGDDKPEKVLKCMESWNTQLQGYEFINWNHDRWTKEGINCIWLNDAYSRKKYAFCSDFLRIYSICKYGGFYLDSDVMVNKSFDELTKLKYYISLEAIFNRGYLYPDKYSHHNGYYFEGAVFGSEKDNKFFNEILDWYMSRSYYYGRTIPQIMKDVWVDKYDHHLNFDCENIDETLEKQSDMDSMFLMNHRYFSYEGDNKNATYFYKHMFMNSWSM